MESKQQKTEETVKLLFNVIGHTKPKWVTVHKKLLMNVPYFVAMFGPSFAESGKETIHIQIEVTKQMVKEYLCWLNLLDLYGPVAKTIHPIYHHIYLPKTETKKYLEDISSSNNLDEKNDLNIVLDGFTHEFSEGYYCQDGFQCEFDSQIYIPNISLSLYTADFSKFFATHITLADYVKKTDIVANVRKKKWSLHTFKLAYFFDDQAFLEHIPKKSTKEIRSVEDIPPELLDWYCNQYISELCGPDFAYRANMFCTANPVLGKLIWTHVEDKTVLLTAMDTPLKRRAAMNRINNFEELCKWVKQIGARNDPFTSEIQKLEKIKASLERGERTQYLHDYFLKYTTIKPHAISDFAEIRPLVIKALGAEIANLKKQRSGLK